MTSVHVALQLPCAVVLRDCECMCSCNSAPHVKLTAAAMLQINQAACTLY
jgi:hypothetical protein